MQILNTNKRDFTEALLLILSGYNKSGEITWNSNNIDAYNVELINYL